MGKATTPSRINGIKIGEVRADVLETLGTLNCKYAFTIGETDKTCGYGTFNMWSDETVQKFKDLVSSMEQDILVTMFEATGPIPSVSEDQPDTGDGVPGL